MNDTCQTQANLHATISRSIQYRPQMAVSAHSSGPHAITGRIIRVHTNRAAPQVQLLHRLSKQRPAISLFPTMMISHRIHRSTTTCSQTLRNTNAALELRQRTGRRGHAMHFSHPEVLQLSRPPGWVTGFSPGFNKKKYAHQP